jgi:hypothetical protein
MTERKNAPGPGRSTSDAAFKELKQQIAARNEAAHQAERKRRAPREQELVAKRRRDSE